MKKPFLITFSAVAIMAATAGTAIAGQDLFTGDTAIYGGVATGAKTNVLFLIDNSAGMSQEGMAKKYDPNTTYYGSFSANEIYVRQAATGGTINYNDYNLAASSITCTDALQALVTGTASYKAPGVYYGPLTKTGDCGGSNTKAGNYYIGNFLNFLFSSKDTWTQDTTYNVGDVVFPTEDSSVTYECTKSGKSGKSAPSWPTETGVEVSDNSVVWQLRQSSILKMTQEAVLYALASSHLKINAGVMVLGDNNHGGKVLSPVLDISNTSEANFGSVKDSVSNITLQGSNLQLINEALWDAGVYYLGHNDDTQLKIASDHTPYPSPIQYSCQFNYIIVLTTGNTPDTTQTKNHLTDLNGDGTKGDAVDAALYNYNKNIQTSVIQLLSPEVPILRNAAEKTGGNYYQVWSSKDLAIALYDMLANIVKETDTSFVAPVVPVSPENRTYSGSRVYMGFFKPIKQQYWHGNLKKYGLDTNNNITDAGGNPATWVDLNDDGVDDRMTASTGTLPPGAINGSFRTAAQSFWSTGQDGGDVNLGGAGAVLKGRSFTSSTTGSDPRKIYSKIGTSNNLTDPSNSFTTANSAITDTTFEFDPNSPSYSTSDRDKLINFIHGIDVYDEDKNGDTTEKRGYDPLAPNPAISRDFFGDVLHSRPLIVSYSQYAITNEGTCSANKSVIYVGSNDGMLHAINDCDGTEAWAFIPPDMLGNLKSMKKNSHAYFVDSTPAAYIYDKDNDGNIETDISNNDKVVIIFGERRGGGSDSAPTSGSYYALDVSDPASPKFLWQINNQNSNFAELAETWSEPKLVKMKIGSVEKIVAFVGAGYDNIHEDTRFGNTRLFSNASSVADTDVGDGDVVSLGTTSASGLTSPKGRGIYAIEIASLDSNGVPSFANSGTKIWGYTFSNDSNMRFSIPSEMAALDSNHDGYADRLYVADTGGQVWRFDVGDNSVSSWSARRLFNLSANSVTGTTGSGRKFFYKPSIVQEPTHTMLFIGSGDREHPLNRDTNLIDRFYALKDLGQTTSSNLNEGNLTDVTTDLLQSTDNSSSISNTLTALSSSYGWYIKLDQHAGEKVLAAPTVFNKVAYFTTYAPSILVAPDPCHPGNAGTARLYAVNYLTGESVLNYDTNNDTGTALSSRAKYAGGGILARSDRVMTVGEGIPSGMVMVINPGGETKALIGVGGVIASEDPKKGGSIIPIYWRQK